MKCILHIGTEKTGTTLLQQWLYDNQHELGKQRVFLSDMLGKASNRLISAYYEQDLDGWARRNGITNQAQKDEFFKDFEARFEQEVVVASRRHKVFVISSEHCHSRLRTVDEISRLHHLLTRCFDEINVVCYFREQADMAISWYSTGIKLSMASSLEGFLKQVARPENYYFDFKSIADNWSEVFGIDACCFRIYDRDRFPERDIRKDFLNTWDVPLNQALLSFDRQSGNESLSRLQAEALRQVNRLIPYWNEQGQDVNPLNKHLKGVLKRIKSLQTGTITSQSASAIYQRFYPQNKAFFDRYFAGEYLFKAKPSDVVEEQSLPISQVGEVIRHVLEELLPMISGGARLRGDDANYLRDIALKYESKENLTAEEASRLLALAKRVRPKGRLINSKLEEYRRKAAEHRS